MAKKLLRSELFLSVFILLAMIITLVSISMRADAAEGPDTLQLPFSRQFSFDTIPGLVADEDAIRAGLLYDVDRNSIVWEKDMDYAYPIASLTKMMVGLLAMEDIEEGKVCADDRITVTRTYKKRIRRHRYTTYTSTEQYSLQDLLKMAMVASHNESTVWIAKHCSGTLEAFVERMNKRAMQLGMTKTLYSNPSGLPAIINELDNSSSPRDLLVLALEIIRHPQLMEITGIPYATVFNGKANNSYRNHNGLVINYSNEVDGIKTGYTKAAKFCLVATSNRGGHRMISIVLGTSSPWVRNGIVASMLNTYYDAIKMGRLGESAPEMDASLAFMDSVSKGLASITPDIEPRHRDDSDESYAYTYKTVTSKIRKAIKVRSGESLGKIAQRQNVTVTELRKWNKLHSTNIRAGQLLYVYSTVKKKVPVKLVVDPDEPYADTQPSQDTSSDVESVETKSENACADTTKTRIASEHAAAKASANNKTAKGSAPKATYVYHLVQPGDTLWNIAQRYQANVEQIKRANKISNSRNLKSGTKIKIPVKGS